MKNLADIDPGTTFSGIGPLGNPVGTGITNFIGFLSTAIGIMTIVAFIWFTFTLLIGGIGIISSGGDKQALESARKKITTGLIGVVIIVSALFILNLVGYIFGIPFLDIFQLFYRVIDPTSGPLPPGIN